MRQDDSRVSRSHIVILPYCVPLFECCHVHEIITSATTRRRYSRIPLPLPSSAPLLHFFQIMWTNSEGKRKCRTNASVQLFEVDRDQCQLVLHAIVSIYLVTVQKKEICNCVIPRAGGGGRRCVWVVPAVVGEVMFLS